MSSGEQGLHPQFHSPRSGKEEARSEAGSPAGCRRPRVAGDPDAEAGTTHPEGGAIPPELNTGLGHIVGAQ